MNCALQYVYLPKDFGFESLYSPQKAGLYISVGTYLFRVTKTGEYAPAEPMDTDSFLMTDLYSTIQFDVDTYLEYHFSDDENDEDLENSYEDDDEYEYEEDDQYDNNSLYPEDRDIWKYYDDNLDMDQQSIDFWNQF